MALHEATPLRHTVEDPVTAIEFCYETGWSDGLPVVPPTEGAVAQFLEYVHMRPSQVVLTEPVSGRVVTAETAAANAIMAGCLKEYFPVVLAALDAMSEPAVNLHGATLNTGGAAVMVVVDGPIVERIGMNSGVALSCPGNRPNSTIGRTLNLVLWNCTGNRPDQMDQTVLGHSGRYSMCIAEREQALPPGWEPLHTERGLPRESSAVTVFPAMHPLQAGYWGSPDPEEILVNVADAIKFLQPLHREMMMIVAPEILQHLGNAGWSKADVGEFMFREARRPAGEMRRAHLPFLLGDTSTMEDGQMVPILERPEALQIVAGGGDGGTFVTIVPLYGAGVHSSSVTREIMGIGV